MHYSRYNIYTMIMVCRIYAILIFLVTTSAASNTTNAIKIATTHPTIARTTFSTINTKYTKIKPTEIEISTQEIKHNTTETLTSESTTIVPHTTVEHKSTKGEPKSARKQNFNSSSSALGSVSRSGRLQEWPGAIECDLPVLPRESRLWRGNETHELNLPVTECGGGEECPPVIESWEASADIQSGDILIVRIADASIAPETTAHDGNTTFNCSQYIERKRVHRAQPAVYQVTRQGHEHCDISDGMLLDITPLEDRGDKLITLYDKDLTEGVNFLIVVSEIWRTECVRLKVTVKSDNCGESQDCSGKGVCYTNVSMESYECQCCPGYVGPHCEDRDACHRSPCLNNGICVQTTQAAGERNYHCLCPYGFTGEKCERDPCYSSPCTNGGSCMSISMNGSTTFHCACADDWAGAHCELPASSGVCASSPCLNGICVEHDDNDVNGRPYRCFCQPGYTGDQCELEYNECESSPCANGGTCTDRVGGFDCVCGRGYTGNTCQLKVDLCSPEPCPPRRLCVDRGSSYSCECPRGLVVDGDDCRLPTTSPCDNNPCSHGGTCWTTLESFYCSCRPGYTGRLCEEDFVLETVVGTDEVIDSSIGGGSVREVPLPLGLYHDRLHNVYIAAGTLGAAIAIVGVVVTACHCRVNKTYGRLVSRLSGRVAAAPLAHWLQDKRAPSAPTHPPAPLDTADMYYTLDFSDSQSSPLIQ